MFTAELVQQQILTTDERTQFFSIVNNFTNGIALVGQLLIVKHVVARFGIGVSLSLLPLVSIIGFALLAFEPTLAVVAILTVVRRSLGFAFGKPTSDMLYSVVTTEEKYKVKNFIDTVVYRGGDAASGWLFTGLSAIGLGLSALAFAAVPLATLWALFGIMLGRARRARERGQDDQETTTQIHRGGI